MKIAIVHDEIVTKGGAEQVTLSFHNAFPDAPIYTLNYDANRSYPEFKQCNIKTSWFGKYIKGEKNMKRFFFPFAVIAMRQLYLEGYDVVLQSTTHCAKYIKTDPKTLIITYCHTPFRLVWNSESYEQVTGAGFIKRKLYNAVISMLKEVEKQSALRTDYFVTNSAHIIPRIKAAYHPLKEVSVINPSVKCANFYVSSQVGDYYLVVSRLESYKKVDVVIEAFNKMPSQKLIVVGSGSREKALKAVAGKNVTFLKNLGASQLSELYANCKAFLFPQMEDYGITPLEANASGRPVVGYGKGGILDTMIPYTNDASKATAVFFDEQTPEAIMNAIALVENCDFNPAFIRKHAEKFDEAKFVKKIRDFVVGKYELRNQGTIAYQTI
jgi:glycosyltransferase involved in cell wall biosynthesis